MQPRLSVGALIIRDGKVLLLCRGPGAPFEVGAWTMPAGGIELGDPIVNYSDGLSCARPYVALIVRGTLTPDDQPYNREPCVHAAIGWFSADEVPEYTWDRELIVRTLREETR